MDILAEKIKTSDLQKYFPGFQGGEFAAWIIHSSWERAKCPSGFSWYRKECNLWQGLCISLHLQIATWSFLSDSHGNHKTPSFMHQGASKKAAAGLMVYACFEELCGVPVYWVKYQESISHCSHRMLCCGVFTCDYKGPHYFKRIWPSLLILLFCSFYLALILNLMGRDVMGHPQFMFLSLFVVFISPLFQFYWPFFFSLIGHYVQAKSEMRRLPWSTFATCIIIRPWALRRRARLSILTSPAPRTPTTSAWSSVTLKTRCWSSLCRNMGFCDQPKPLPALDSKGCWETSFTVRLLVLGGKDDSTPDSKQQNPVALVWMGSRFFLTWNISTTRLWVFHFSFGPVLGPGSDDGEGGHNSATVPAWEGWGFTPDMKSNFYFILY